jgi:hypothetical protein
LLDSLNLRYEIVSPSLSGPPLAAELDSFFYTYGEMIDTLFSWQWQFSSIARVETIGYSLQEQRAIFAIKLSDSVGVDQDEPVMLFDGTHHACEIMGMEICMALADTLLHYYSTDSNITTIVNSTEIWIVPLINPDGNSAVHAGISLNYRKNGRDHDHDGNLYEYECNDSWTCPTEGVDVNRNYDWYWEDSGSGTPMNYYYRGPFAGSESENVAITGLVAKIRPIISVTYHSWGEVVYYPWQWSDGSFAPDHDIIYDIASSMAANIERENDQGYYDPTPSGGRGGLALNWQYARYGVISFLPETVAYPDFIPGSEARRSSIVAANLQGVFYLFARADGSQITGRVSDIRTHVPLQAEIRVLENYSDLVNPRMSDSLYGRYTRLLLPGSYTVRAIHPDYPVKTFSEISILDGQPTVLDIHLGSIIPGDANDSGVLNGVDVIFLVNYFKGHGPAPDPIELGDANGDCVTNGLDVLYLVNYFKGGPPPGECGI